MQADFDHLRKYCAKNLLNRAVAAMFPSAAVVAVFTAPDEVELLDERLDEGWVVGEDAVLEVALALRLRAHAGAGEVGAAEVGLYAIHDDALEVDARAEHPLHPAPQAGIAVKVLAPVRPRLLRVDEPHLDPAPHHPRQHLQERHHVPPSRFDIHVLDVGGRNPQPLPHLRHNPADDGGVDVAVGEEGGHGAMHNPYIRDSL